MRKIFPCFVVSALILLAAAHLQAADAIKVMTFNLRYASDRPPNSWPERRPVMKDCIEKADPDVIGTQEGVFHQLKDIHKDLPQYTWIGLGREGGSKGEFMAIFYKHEQFEPMQFDHFWLSDTPEVIGSTTWGNSNRRMVTWVRFKLRDDGREFFVLNTHFDHEIQVAREKSAELLRQRIDALKTDLPIIVLGDFNAKADANKAYETLTGGDFLKDTWNSAKERRGESVPTFHGFRGPRKEDNRIDWILTRGALNTDWIEISTCSRKGQFPSDHFPVTAQVRFE